MSDIDNLKRLVVVYDDLAPDARNVLMRIAERLHAGQVKYGVLNLAHDPRDWLEEQQQERADELVYGEFYIAQQEAR